MSYLRLLMRRRLVPTMNLCCRIVPVMRFIMRFMVRSLVKVKEVATLKQPPHLDDSDCIGNYDGRKNNWMNNISQLLSDQNPLFPGIMMLQPRECKKSVMLPFLSLPHPYPINIQESEF